MKSPEESQSPENVTTEYTEVGDFDRETEGYIFIMPLPEEAKEQIGELQDTLAKAIGESKLWLPKDDQLHITFAHVISPDATYPEDRSELFEQTSPQLDPIMPKVTDTLRDAKLRVADIKCFRAAIILTFTDEGAIAKARDKFAQSVDLPEGTRNPPNIIHTTIARFREPINMEQVKRVVDLLSAEIPPIELERLQLVQEHEMYTQSHDVLKEYTIPKSDSAN